MNFWWPTIDFLIVRASDPRAAKTIGDQMLRLEREKVKQSTENDASRGTSVDKKKSECSDKKKNDRS